MVRVAPFFDSQCRKAVTRGRTDRFTASVTNLQFPIRSAFLPRRRDWFSQSHFQFQPKKERLPSCDLEL